MSGFSNPVIPGFHPDPSVCRVGEDYWLVTSSFEYFPGVPLFHSRDLVHWRQAGHVLTRVAQLPLEKAGCSAGIFAPTIRHARGRFWMITTNVSISRHILVHAVDPAGPWSDPILLEHGWIDPSLLFDDDGRVYMQANGHGGIVQRELDPETGAWLSESRAIWAGSGGQALEAPHLYRIGDSYLLLCAEGGTEYGHMVTCARGPSPWGPFSSCPRNPILSHRSLGSPIHATGHAELVQDHRGGWWMLCLGIRPVGYPNRHHIGRETFLAPVTWVDGWPVVNGGQPLALAMPGPTLPAQPWPAEPVRDAFTSLGSSWNFLRNPRPGSWALLPGGGLRLNSTAATLDDEDSPAWIGRRQQHHRCTFRVRFTAAAGECGVTVFMNARHHYEVAVTGAAGSRRAIVRRRIGSLQAVVAERPCPDGPFELAIDATPERYRLLLGGEVLGDGETCYLATEVAGGFTGVYLAMYASGPGAQADIAWADYTPGEQP